MNDRIAAIDAQIKALAKTEADMRRLMEIPGVGPTLATALVAAVGTGSSFGKGRDLAAWLGLMPRQITTGGKRIKNVQQPMPLETFAKHHRSCFGQPSKTANCFAQIKAQNLNVHQMLLSPPIPATVAAGWWEGSSSP